MLKICAVVVTYNRKELLVRNIKSLLKQSYPLDIIIFDNASTDGTFDYLNETGLINRANVIYVQGEKNGGGSYGFCKGEKEACAREYDYIWLMDDDGYCLRDDTLEQLVKHCDSGKKQILNSYVICNEQTKEPTFQLGPYKTNNEVAENAVNNLIIGYGNPYNGTLVPKACFDEIGFTDERFFIYGDEYEFFLRSKNAGYIWITVLGSLYYHPVNRYIREYKFLGYTFDAKVQPVWKFYLEYRNSRYIYKKHFHKSSSIKLRMKMLLSAIFSKDKKLKRIKWGWLGINDGAREFFDRPIPFGE